MVKIKKELEIKFYFFPTFRKITVGGFVNQLIKKIWPKYLAVTYFTCDDIIFRLPVFNYAIFFSFFSFLVFFSLFFLGNDKRV